SIARDVRGPSLRGGGRSHVVWPELRGHVPALRRLHRQDPQGRQTGRSPGRAGLALRAGREPENGEGSRSHPASLGPPARGRGHPVTEHASDARSCASAFSTTSGTRPCTEVSGPSRTRPVDPLIESLSPARLLLFVNYRPEYQRVWGSNDHSSNSSTIETGEFPRLYGFSRRPPCAPTR